MSTHRVAALCRAVVPDGRIGGRPCSGVSNSGIRTSSVNNLRSLRMMMMVKVVCHLNRDGLDQTRATAAAAAVFILRLLRPRLLMSSFGHQFGHDLPPHHRYDDKKSISTREASASWTNLKKMWRPGEKTLRRFRSILFWFLEKAKRHKHEVERQS